MSEAGDTAVVQSSKSKPGFDEQFFGLLDQARVHQELSRERIESLIGIRRLIHKAVEAAAGPQCASELLRIWKQLSLLSQNYAEVKPEVYTDCMLVNLITGDRTATLAVLNKLRKEFTAAFDQAWTEA